MELNDNHQLQRTRYSGRCPLPHATEQSRSPNMNDRLPLNEEERKTRSLLVTVARAMLAGELSYHEGSVVVLGLRARLGGVLEFDEDFNAFVVIGAETDHLPLKAQRPFWDQAALERMAPEYERTEEWARGFASVACENLIGRFVNG